MHFNTMQRNHDAISHIRFFQEQANNMFISVFELMPSIPVTIFWSHQDNFLGSHNTADKKADDINHDWQEMS